jgi:hypothetical protein
MHLAFIRARAREASLVIPAQARIHLRLCTRERSYETNYDRNGFAPVKTFD